MAELFTQKLASWTESIQSPLEPAIQQLVGQAGTRISDIDQWTKLGVMGKEIEIISRGIDALWNAGTNALLLQYHASNFFIRQGLELLMFGVQYSLEEIKLNKWLINQQDIYWSYLVSDADTIAKYQVIKLLCEPISNYSDEYFSICSSIYKETSRYVHGNMESFTDLDERSDCFERIISTCTAIEYYLFARYYCKLDQNSFEGLHLIFSENKFHHEEFRFIFEEGMQHA